MAARNAGRLLEVLTLGPHLVFILASLHPVCIFIAIPTKQLASSLTQQSAHCHGVTLRKLLHIRETAGTLDQHTQRHGGSSAAVHSAVARTKLAESRCHGRLLTTRNFPAHALSLGLAFDARAT